MPAYVAGLLLVAGIAACDGDAAGSGEPTADVAARPSATVRTMPEWDGEDGEVHTPIEPGSYLVPSSPWSIADFTVTFPAGWTTQYGHVYASNVDTADEFGFYAVTVDEIFADSCDPENETTRAVGPGVDALYRALRRQAGGASVSAPVSTTLGGYPASRIDLEVPKRVDVAACRMAPAGLQIWYSAPADKYFVLLDDGASSVYVVDVDGRRLVFLTQVGDSTSAADRAELQAVLDSIRIEGAPATPGAAADGSLYFAADARGGDALTNPVSHVQAELHPKPSDLYLSRRGAPVRRVVAGDGSDRCPRVSPDGGHLAYLQGATLVVAPLDATGEPGAPRVRARLHASPFRPRGSWPFPCPQWSPDGRRVGYVAYAGDASPPTAEPVQVRAVSVDGDDRVIAAFGVEVGHPPAFAWSPDGEEVAYTTEGGVWRARPGGTAELLWRPVGGPAQEVPTALAWSRRGELAFTASSSERDGTGTGTWTVRVVDPGSGRTDRVGAAAVDGAAAWSPDGRRLAFPGPDGQVRLHDRSTGTTSRVAPGLGGRGGVREVAWSPDGHQLLAIVSGPGSRGPAIVSVPLHGSTTERRTPWTFALDATGLEDVDWSSR